MSEAAQTLTLVIPLRLKPRGGRKAMVTPGVLALEHRQDITLIKALARAFRWRRMLHRATVVKISGESHRLKDRRRAGLMAAGSLPTPPVAFGDQAPQGEWTSAERTRNVQL
jgi:hypothetical protein